ncbi:hypothetical protein KDX04_26900 [Burkholderia cenocepacia]|nr:hypothetical protein [Burkholderia cenocepacia]MBR7989462.1 hypothetical protein [Burkholderia cenocepacia]
MTKKTEIEALLEQIARDHLSIETLECRHSDRLDFHDCGVRSIHSALMAAFIAGSRCGGSSNTKV